MLKSSASLNRLDLPVARNPLAYVAPGTKIPNLPPPPPNFSDQRVKQAEYKLLRQASNVRSTALPEQFPMRLKGVAPADRVPIREVGANSTRPQSALRAFVSNRSNGVILYQAALPPGFK